MKKKKGFTLAEVLVTLAIIGVVAAVAVPTVVNNKPNKEMVMFKKAYYNTTRVVSDLINDEEFYPDSPTPGEGAGFSQVEIHQFNGGNEARYHGIEYVGDSKFCGLFISKLVTTEGADNPNTLCADRVSLAAGGNFRTADGIIWSMPVSDFSSGSEDIYVDVNGPLGDNCTRDPGAEDVLTTCTSNTQKPDQFIIRIGNLGSVTLPGRLAQLYLDTQGTTKRFEEFLRFLED